MVYFFKKIDKKHEMININYSGGENLSVCYIAFCTFLYLLNFSKQFFLKVWIEKSEFILALQDL